VKLYKLAQQVSPKESTKTPLVPLRTYYVAQVRTNLPYLALRYGLFLEPEKGEKALMKF
jgi:hypothetical protein